MKSVQERKACLLLRPQDRSRAEAYLTGRGMAVTDTLAEGTDFLLAEDQLLFGTGVKLLDRCRELGVPLFLLAERDESPHEKALSAAVFVFYKPLVLELALRRIFLLLGEEDREGGRHGWFTLQAQCSLDALSVPRHLLAFRYFSDGVGLLADMRYPLPGEADAAAVSSPVPTPQLLAGHGGSGHAPRGGELLAAGRKGGPAPIFRIQRPGQAGHAHQR